MVANDSVDSDIYDMQERKAKMESAIMSSTDEWSKQEKKEKANVMKTAVDRFLCRSPPGHYNVEKAKIVKEKENAVNLYSDNEKETEI